MGIPVFNPIRFFLQFGSQLIFHLRFHEFLCHTGQNPVHVLLCGGITGTFVGIVMGNTGIAAFIEAVGFLKSNPSGFFFHDLLNDGLLQFFSISVMPEFSGSRLPFPKWNGCIPSQLFGKLLFCIILIFPELFDQLPDILPPFQQNPVGAVIPDTGIGIVHSIVRQRNAFHQLFHILTVVSGQVIYFPGSAILEQKIAENGKPHVSAVDLIGDGGHDFHHTDAVQQNSGTVDTRKCIAHPCFDVDILQDIADGMCRMCDRCQCRFVLIGDVLPVFVQRILFIHRQLIRYVRIEPAGIQCFAVNGKHGEIGIQNMSQFMSGKTRNAVRTQFSCGIASRDGISGIDVNDPVVRPCHGCIIAVVPEGSDLDAPFIPFGSGFGKVGEIGGISGRSEKLLIGDGQLFILDSFSYGQVRGSHTF